MTEIQNDILIKNGWKRCNDDEWVHPEGPPGCPTYISEEDAIAEADYILYITDTGMETSE